jgi:hypothetical protein
MNPDLPPIYRGHDIRPNALLVELTDPSRAAKAVQLIEDPKGGLIATGVVTAWRHLEGMADAPAVQQRMKEARDYVGSVPYAQELLGREAMLSVRAAAHATAVQPRNVDVSRAEVAALDTRQARKQAWWAKVHDDGTSPYAPVVALLTEPAAREQSDKADAKEQAERQEAERKRQAERRAAEQAQREREREQLERERVQRDAEVDQLRRRDLRVIKWAGILLVPGLALGFWRINNQLDGSGQLSQDLGALMEAAPGSMFWGALWAGSFAGLGLCALVLLLRGKFGRRQTGTTLMAVMGLLAVGLYFVGLNAANSSLDDARSSMYSSPVPTSRFDTCRGTSYWTSTFGARRTFVDSDCQTVRSYEGWFESWDHRSGQAVSGLHGLGPVYLVLASNGQSFAALSKESGEQLWDMHCPDGVDLNEEMFDQGDQTPTDQFAAGTCNGQPFILDPRTGGAP